MTSDRQRALEEFWKAVFLAAMSATGHTGVVGLSGTADEAVAAFEKRWPKAEGPA